MFHTAKLLAAQDVHSLRLRSAMDLVMQDVVDEYRDGVKDDPGMIKVLDNLQWQAPRMFAFLEHPDVDPTSNLTRGRCAISCAGT